MSNNKNRLQISVPSQHNTIETFYGAESQYD